ncbi:MAG: helix-turn-helix transcriptional regulator [Clostridia bacterium]|nr:helix-turn-helix transcriptional regulator [Clostridia bacterium]
MKPHKEELPMVLLGARLRALRLRRGVSQQEVARQLQVDRTTYTKYENGRVCPDHQALVRLAEYHGVTLDCLLGREEMADEAAVSDADDYKWTLSLPERQLVQMFRQLPEELKTAMVKEMEKSYLQNKQS